MTLRITKRQARVETRESWMRGGGWGRGRKSGRFKKYKKGEGLKMAGCNIIESFQTQIFQTGEVSQKYKIYQNESSSEEMLLSIV